MIVHRASGDYMVPSKKHDGPAPMAQRFSATTIMIADDHDVVRRGVRAIIESRPGWEIVGEADDGARAFAIAEQTKPTVAVIDYSLPSLNGAELTRRIKTVSPDTEVLIFTMHDNEVLMRDVLAAGARGFLLKSDADKQLIAAIESMIRRQPFFTGRVTEAFLKLYLSQPAIPGETTLTAREREVVQLIAEGHSSKSASRILNISLKTVESHRGSAMHKLGITTTAALVRYAIRNKLIEP
ncbi:two component transcriptional regulator, LuxR family [Beijerinckia sp. 28-YEA-48]|nr:two component transcriptional regulator, LuxR family [Beijerinckia sp. 28-YEA-48]